MEPRYTIGQLARSARIATSAVRYYERRKLLPPAGRTEGNYRYYGPAALERLRFLRAAQAIGFTLKDISTLLDFSEGKTSPCKEVQALLETRLRDIRTRLDQMREVETVLASLLRMCRRNEQTGRCHVMDRLKGTQITPSAASRRRPRKS